VSLHGPIPTSDSPIDSDLPGYSSSADGCFYFVAASLILSPFIVGFVRFLVLSVCFSVTK